MWNFMSFRAEQSMQFVLLALARAQEKYLLQANLRVLLYGLECPLHPFRPHNTTPSPYMGGQFMNMGSDCLANSCGSYGGLSRIMKGGGGAE